MTLTFNSINIRPDSVNFFGSQVDEIILDFDTNEVHFEGKRGSTHTIFYNYTYGGGVSHHSFRVPDPSGEGSVAVVIFDNGTFGIQDFLHNIPQWARTKIEAMMA